MREAERLRDLLNEIIAINDESAGDFRKRGGTRRGLSIVAARDALVHLAALAAPPAPQPASVDKRATGLIHKFNVTRTDGSSAPGGKHDGCNYFVLDLTHDPHALPALRAYADSCRAAYPVLAADLDAKLPMAAAPPAPQPASDGEKCPSCHQRKNPYCSHGFHAPVEPPAAATSQDIADLTTLLGNVLSVMGYTLNLTEADRLARVVSSAWTPALAPPATPTAMPPIEVGDWVEETKLGDIAMVRAPHHVEFWNQHTGIICEIRKANGHVWTREPRA